MKKILLVLSVICGITLTSCGGGGGGGGGASGSSSPTGVRVLHGVIDAVPIDVISSNKQAVAQTGKFGMPSLYGGLDAGSQVLSITRAHDPGSVIATVPLDLAKQQHVSILFYGSNEQYGLHARLLDDSPGEFSGDEAKIRVVDGLVGAQQIEAIIDGQSIGNPVQFGGDSGYVSVGVGVHNVSLVRSSDRRTVGKVTLSTDKGNAYTIFAAGEVDYYSVTTISIDN